MKQSKLVVVLLLTIFVTTVVGSPSVYAQETEMSQKAELREQRAADLEAKRAEIQENREARIENREEIREDLQENREERQENREERRAEIQERIAERTSNFVEKLTAKVGRYYERLSKLSEKLQARITVLVEGGVDTTAAQAKLTAADAALESAYEKALAIISELEAMEVNATTFGQFMAKVQELKAPFRQALVLYKEAFELVKEASTKDSATQESSSTQTREE